MNNLREFYENRKVGFKNIMGETVIPPIYEFAFPFSDGLASVYLGGYWGAINKIGQTIVPFRYADMGLWRHGLAPVKINGLWGFINKQSEVVIKPKYYDASSFFFDNVYENGLIAVVQKNYSSQDEDSRILINKKGKKVNDGYLFFFVLDSDFDYDKFEACK